MRIIECQQGTPEWLDARISVVTASNMDRIITNKTRKPSASMVKYSYEMLAEELLGRPLNDQSSGFMLRGSELEAEARAWFSFECDVDVERVGFIVRDDGLIGCSPDGLVGEDSGLELKCPSAGVHLGYLLGGGLVEDYFAQIQCCLWITERTHWWAASYCPGLPSVLVRVERDDDFIIKMSACVDTFLDLLDQHRATLRTLGYLPPLDDVDGVAEAA